MDRRKFIKTAGAATAGIALAGCAGTDQNEATDEEPDPAQDDGAFDIEGEAGETPDYLELTSFTAYETSEDVGVLGVVTNVGDQPLSGVEVEVTLRDGDTVLGEFVDTAEAEIDTLRPDNSWRFRVVFEDESVSDATGFSVSADAEVAEEADA